MESATLFQEIYDSRSFGNAIATYRLGVLIIRFVRDRDVETVDVGSLLESDRLYGFYHLAVFRGWITMEEMLKNYDINVDMDEPSGPVLELDEALCLIGRDLHNLQELFSRPRLESTQQALDDMGASFLDAFRR